MPGADNGHHRNGNGHAEPSERRVLELVEPVTFEDRTRRVTVKAKVDTGAKRTSIDRALAEALGITPNGRTVKVRTASRKTRQKRKLAQVPLHVGGRKFRVEASLVDRTHMSYPVIVGQDVLSEGGFKVQVEAGGISAAGNGRTADGEEE